MRTFRSALLVAVMLPFINGCVYVGLHSTRAVEVHVTARTTQQPVSGADISIEYGLPDGYWFIHMFRIPEAASTRTDSNGVAVLPMATASHIFFEVDGKNFDVTPGMIRRGGDPTGVYYSRDPKTGKIVSTNFYPIVVQLIPKK